MKDRIVKHLDAMISENDGWCAIILNTGEEVTIIRTQYGPDAHDIMIDGTVVKECADLYEVVDWILERSV